MNKVSVNQLAVLGEALLPFALNGVAWTETHAMQATENRIFLRPLPAVPVASEGVKGFTDVETVESRFHRPPPSTMSNAMAMEGSTIVIFTVPLGESSAIRVRMRLTDKLRCMNKLDIVTLLDNGQTV